MATISQPAEFTLQRDHTADRSNAVKWIVSHATRYWPILIMIFFGALGNAALAAVVPVLVGDAFNQMLQPNPDTSI
jgi:ATP-binding cassette subfamily B protein